ncbi:MAG: hypothetical protein S4CHLAM37_15040 [Chlamydiia bacterium]|nr:hypothetical protein [Chlamydiia bacterium]
MSNIIDIRDYLEENELSLSKADLDNIVEEVTESLKAEFDLNNFIRMLMSKESTED